VISSIPGTHFYGQKLHPLSGADDVYQKGCRSSNGRSRHGRPDHTGIEAAADP
jgi:hypothetical protein